mgnify:CR=1 FL=1
MAGKSRKTRKVENLGKKVRKGGNVGKSEERWGEMGEIEMKKQKRDREKRKSRYLKETGGLKYTAIAMANKAELS